MSVRTTADEKLDEAKDLINQAYKLLLEVLNPDTYGSDEYEEEYINTVHESVLDLLKIKRKLL